MPELRLPQSTIAKMDKPGPRYTSYPTADRFDDNYPIEVHVNTLAALGRNQRHKENISLYFHIPFCQSVCFYCACNKVVTMHQHRADEYLNYLLKEIDMVTHYIGKKLPVSQIHFGGGTPTYLTDEQLGSILDQVRKKFNVNEDVECGIEIDPRTVNYDRLNRLEDMGFNRISIGVQDFDGDVQKAVHRVQPFRQVAELFLTAKKLAIESINMDMIYGLPKQTPETFAQSLETLIDLKPDRIALYAYAHLPERFKPQRRIISEDLPTASMRLEMLQLAIETLTRAGYEYIGMDHFALPTDSLAIAKKAGKLQRNFQGYSTHAKTNLIGFGISAISFIDGNYSQNMRDLLDYEDAIANQALPLFRGYESNLDDQIRYAVIMQIMCQGEVNFEDFNQRFKINFKDYFATEITRLSDLVAEDLCDITPNGLKVSEVGWYLVRAVAMRFDKYLQNSIDHQTRFSKIV